MEPSEGGYHRRRAERCTYEDRKEERDQAHNDQHQTLIEDIDEGVLGHTGLPGQKEQWTLGQNKDMPWTVSVHWPSHHCL
jgi:hypothetical protein